MAKILLIDDDKQVLEVVTSFLERERHEISTAADGKQGISLLKNRQFDLVITDVIMPEQDGLEVLMWLKLNKQSCQPKVIAISGGAASLDLNGLLNMCRLLSADKVLPKPVDFETLSTAVREVLESGVEGYQKQA
jgi:CheY-like chemotaxis protein